MDNLVNFLIDVVENEETFLYALEDFFEAARQLVLKDNPFDVAFMEDWMLTGEILKSTKQIILKLEREFWSKLLKEGD